MDICDEFEAIARLRLEDFSADGFEAIARAVRGEQERRRCQASTLSEPPPARLRPEPERRRRLRRELERVAETEQERRDRTERWTTSRMIVERQWLRDFPWSCEICGAEWCKVRNPPAWARRAADPPRAAVEVPSSYGAPHVNRAEPANGSGD